MPIRLWSTVEIQLQKPCSSLGRANGRAGARVVTATAIAGLLQSLEGLQERHQLVDLGVGEVGARLHQVRHAGAPVGPHRFHVRDRKSTRLNSSHGYISYAVFCLKK